MTNKKLFQSLNGKFLRGIGKISFPLYLVHTLVICSLSSYIFLKLATHGLSTQTNLILVFIVTAACSITLAIPLSKFDDWWVKQVDSAARRALSKTPNMA
jgi:peptidoglycan/LPS O-acetylase OafA/YrhL